MFKTQNFCHIASNNRNQVKAGVFVYRTTDDLATVSASGYFNERIIDINLHDLIIHEKIDASDATKVQRNVLCVTERTLENVGVVVIKSKWEEDIEGDIEDLDGKIAALKTYVEQHFVNIDGSSIMSGPLKFRAGSFEGAIAGGLGDGISVYKMNADGSINSEVAALTKTNGFIPGTTNSMNIGSSSLKWKDAYIGRVISGVLNNGADINVPTTAGTLALKSDIGIGINNISNCITEIPQDINLTLSSGTLTLVAGSKITAPNGTQRTTTNNQTGTLTTDGQYMVFAATNDGALQLSSSYTFAQCGSGSSLPADGSTYKAFYNTTDKKMYRWNGSSWVEWGVTFPLAIITVSNSAISSIDQVFNGFGYIGSSAFVLPGVKGLMPNGLNDDGTLKNMSVTVQNVIIKTIPSNTGWHYIVINNTGTNFDFSTEFYIGTSLPANTESYSRFYNIDKNETYVVVSGNLSKAVMFVPNIRIEHQTPNPYKITSMQTGKVFHAVDYTDFIAADAQNVKLSGNQTISGTKTFSSTISGSINGNAATVTNGVYTTGNQTIGGTKTFSVSPIVPTPAASDDSTKVATTAWVQGHGILIDSQMPTALNNYQWYRKYSDGWVEQGGITSTGSHTANITLPVAMSDTNYVAQATNGTSGAGWVQITAKSTTGLSIQAFSSDFNSRDVGGSWYVSGIAA